MDSYEAVLYLFALLFGGCVAMFSGGSESIRGKIRNRIRHRGFLGVATFPTEARRFALGYFDALDPDRALGRFKQMLRVYTAGELFTDNRPELLRITDALELRAAI